jgi:hypothetical protein
MLLRREIACLSSVIMLSIPLSSGVCAQPDKADSLYRIITELQGRLQILESEVNEINGMNSSTLIAGRNGAVYLPQPSPAQTPIAQPLQEAPSLLERSGVDVSGFMDGIYSVNPDNGNDNNAGLNQVEVDLSHALNERTTAALAIAYDDGSFGVGFATIQYALRHTEAGGSQNTPLISDWSVTAGKFNPPFGLDYQACASTDRKSVSVPQIVEKTHDDWVDVGAVNTFSSPYGSMDFYVVKGFDSHVWRGEGPAPEGVSEDDEHWCTITPGMSSGLRLNVVLLPGVEGGGSLMRGWAGHGEAVMTLSGLHLHADWKKLGAKIEAIRLRKAENTIPEVSQGGYAETLENAGRIFLLQRLDYVEEAAATPARLCSMGAGVEAGAGVECRTEYRWDIRTRDRQLFFQIAARF